MSSHSVSQRFTVSICDCGQSVATAWPRRRRAPAAGRARTYPELVNIEAVIAALGGRFDTDETEVIERVLRDHGGTIPDKQLIEEIGLALAIFRRQQRPQV